MYQIGLIPKMPLRDLKALIDEEIMKVQQLKHKAREIKEMNAKSRTIQTQQSVEAISTAWETTQGIHAPQTTWAWDTVDEISSSQGDLAP